jgi:hypothetical protein
LRSLSFLHNGTIIGQDIGKDIEKDEMQLTTLKLVTIICESVLEEQIIETIKSCGGKGYTVVASRGEGSRGMRAGEIPGENVRIEALTSPPVAEAIMKEISDSFFQSYSIVCYITDAAVLRGEKYI